MTAYLRAFESNKGCSVEISL